MDERPAFRHPNRVLLNATPRRRQGRGELAWFLVCLAVFALSFWLQDLGYFWLAMGVLVLLAAGGALFVLAGTRAWSRQIEMDDARADELAGGFIDVFEVRGELPWGWPVIITLLLLLFAPIAWGTRFTLNAATGVAAGLLVATIIAWTLALRLHRVRARFSASGLEVLGKFIPWRGVLSIDPDMQQLLTGVGRWSSRPRLCFRLSEPLSPQDAGGKWFSGVAMGHSRRVIFVSLSRTTESPSVVFSAGIGPVGQGSLEARVRGRHRVLRWPCDRGFLSRRSAQLARRTPAIPLFGASWSIFAAQGIVMTTFPRACPSSTYATAEDASASE